MKWQLEGLRTDNLQGYLAALGVVRLLPGSRLGWDLQQGCAVLENPEDPLPILAEILKAKDRHRRLMWLTKKKDSSNQLKELEKRCDELKEMLKQVEDPALKDELGRCKGQIKALNDLTDIETFNTHKEQKAPADWGSQPDDGLWMHTLWSPDGKPNQLDPVSGAGNDKAGLFGAMEKARNLCQGQAIGKLQEALFGPWRHEDNIGSLFWEYESMGYGPRHQGPVSPEHAKKRAVAGAQWLACNGLPVLGYVGADMVYLPLWTRPETYPVVLERIKHRQADAWMLASKDKLPGDNGRWYWTARTTSDAKNPAGSRKKNQPNFKDLYDGSEIWIA